MSAVCVYVCVFQTAEAAPKGPYSQLTHTELVSMALRQQEQISHRDARIQELEQYIDNLLVRVMEEKPSILMSMNTMKKFIWALTAAGGGDENIQRVN